VDAHVPAFADRAYWVERGRLMAGAYPGEYDAAHTRRVIESLVESGIRTFLCLMEAREDSADELPLPAYAPVVAQVADRFGVALECLRFAIHDMSVPSPVRMAEIEAAIDASLGADRPVYLHCWRGRGRTGTVVGVYLIRRGLATPENFVEVIRDLRAHHDDLGASPETGAQVEFVRSYVTGAYRGA
jgi:hypothetical protein